MSAPMELTTIPIIRPWLGEEEVDAAVAAMRSGWVAQGPQVAEFEREFAALVGAADGVAVSSCTTALHLALIALGVGPGDEVIVPSFSFIATTNVVLYVGATPVFRRRRRAPPATCTPSPSRPRITPRTQGDYRRPPGRRPGRPRRVQRRCATRMGIAVVEDAACAVGSTYAARSSGRGAELARVLVPSAQGDHHRRGRHGHRRRPGSRPSRSAGCASTG